MSDKDIDLRQDEYKSEPRKGEPIFHPGGLKFILGFIATVAFWTIVQEILK